jgi:hypothetical protein
MNTYVRLFTFLVILSVVAACKKITPEAPLRTSLDSTLQVPVSVLNIPVHYPVKDLENLANEKLTDKIIEAKLPISQNNDTIFLSISKFKRLTIAYDGDRGLTYKLPVEINGFIHSKVLGIKIQNKEPVHAKIIITLFSDLYLDTGWDLVTQSEVKSIEWVEEPKIKVAGININLKGTIENILDKNKEKITQKLDESTADLVKIRQSVEKLWVDIQKPIRINRKVLPVWLKGDAVNMDGRLLRRSKDTLMIEVGLYATLRTVYDSAASMTTPKPLPPFKMKAENDPGLNAYAHIIVPFDKINTVIRQVTDTMKFTYGKHRIRIKSSEVYGTDEGIAIRVSVAGDLKADLYLRGTIGFDSVARKLVIENFGFDVNTESSLVNAANWFAYDRLIDRIQPYLSIELEKAFHVIPDLIVKGVEKGKLGSKIQINFSEFDLNIYQYLITRDNIQVIASAQGVADVQLQKGLFAKKKKRPV